MYVVYYPDKVEIYENHKLIDSNIYLTGLPIWKKVNMINLVIVSHEV